jgi:hypothetical protein
MINWSENYWVLKKKYLTPQQFHEKYRLVEGIYYIRFNRKPSKGLPITVPRLYIYENYSDVYEKFSSVINNDASITLYWIRTPDNYEWFFDFDAQIFIGENVYD